MNEPPEQPHDGPSNHFTVLAITHVACLALGMIAGWVILASLQHPLINNQRSLATNKPIDQEIMTVWEDRTNWLDWTNVALVQKSNLATLYIEAPIRVTNKLHVRITMAQVGPSNEWAVDQMEMRLPDGWFKESPALAK